MKKRSRLILIITLVSVIMLAGIAYWGYVNYLKPEFLSEDDEKAYAPYGEYGADILNNVYRTDVIWYGKQYPFNYEVPLRFETEYTDEVLKKRTIAGSLILC